MVMIVRAWPARRWRAVTMLTDELLAGVQDNLLAPLSPGERDQLARLLSRVLAHYGGS